MDATRAYLLELLGKNRTALIESSTDIAFTSGTVRVPREDVAQMLTGVVSLMEEHVRGESREIRSMFLETALPGIVESRTSSWEEVLQSGLPCWGVLVGRLTAMSDAEHKDRVLELLSVFMGHWWSDVSKVMLPLYKAQGTL